MFGLNQNRSICNASRSLHLLASSLSVREVGLCYRSRENCGRSPGSGVADCYTIRCFSTHFCQGYGYVEQNINDRAERVDCQSPVCPFALAQAKNNVGKS